MIAIRTIATLLCCVGMLVSAFAGNILLCFVCFVCFVFAAFLVFR